MSEEPPAKKIKRSDYRETKRKAGDDREDAAKLPQKKFYRQRAHANPFSDHQLEYPSNPALMDWSVHFPAFIDHEATESAAKQLAVEQEEEKSSLGPYELTILPEKQVTLLTKPVEIADIGCGFGGLLVTLAPHMPDKLMIGMEIRLQVTEFVSERIRALRYQQKQLRSSSMDDGVKPDAVELPEGSEPLASVHEMVSGGYDNISVIRANAMKFLPNFFRAHSLTTIFLCYPDPHFKARKHKARIVSPTLNDEYAYVLKPGGRIYHVTDVQDLHEWMSRHFREHASFEEVQDDQLGEEGKWLVKVIQRETEEGKKVERNQGEKFVGVWQVVPFPDNGPRLGVDGVYMAGDTIPSSL